ncbi:MAG: D-alanyl-D-alanine carboxypeptidase [Candidatus Omnitrophica bacterium]|nr:D-alanyl-D-alanine carboxypeptidase [Candidatus Omnitrophota bacterium]
MTGSMRHFRIFGVVCLALLIAFPQAAQAAKKVRKKAAGPYHVSAASALLYDESGWHKYFGRAVDRKVFPASTTKVMTALIVLERLDLDAVVVISKAATDVLPSKVDLKPGEKYRVRDLLYAALLNSANDAAAALAEAVAGSQDKFVDLMNDRARQLGAKNTLFANPHGLPSSRAQYTTAYDMFLIFRTALKKEFFRDAIKIRTMSVQSVDGRKIALKSHNKSLFKGWHEGVYGKTGYTRAAMACFVGVVYKGKQALIVAVFGCPGATRWDDIKFIIEHYGGIDL